MGLLDSVFNSLLPKQSRPAQGRPFIDIGQQGSQVAEFTQAGLSPLNAFTMAPVDNIVTRVNNALFKPGVTVGIDHRYLSVSISPQFVVQALQDPNAAVDSAIDFTRDKIYGADAKFLEGGRKWVNFIQGWTDLEKNRLLKYSLAKAGYASTDPFARRVLGLLNENDVMHVSDDTRELAFAEIRDNAKSSLSKAGVDTQGLTAVDQYLSGFDNLSIRRAFARKMGVSGEGKRGLRKAKLLGSMVNQDLAQMGLDLPDKASAIIQGSVNSMLESDSAIIDKDDRLTYQKKAFDRIIKGLNAGTPEQKKLAERLYRIVEGKGIGFFSVIKFTNVFNQARLLWGDPTVLATNFTTAILNGDIWLILGSSEWLQDFALMKSQGVGKLRDTKVGRAMGVLFLLHPGAFVRTIWDGDWTKVLNNTFFKGNSEFLKNFGIRNQIQNFINQRIGKLGITNAISIANSLGMTGLAQELQKMSSAGLQAAAKSAVQYAIRKAFQSVSDAFIKLAMKFGTKGLIHGALQAVGSAVPVIGNLVAAVVGWVVSEIIEKVVWSALRVFVKGLLFVLAAFAALLVWMYSVRAHAGAFMQNDVVPGQVGSGEIGTTVPGGDTSILDGTAGGGYAIDYSASLTQLDLDYVTGSVFDSIKCTQGYNGRTSHKILVETKNTYAVDLAPTDGTKMVKSPINGVVSIYPVGLSQDYIIITEENPATGKATNAQFVFVHIDADTCVVKSGDHVAVNDPLCEMYSLSPAQGNWVIGCGSEYSELKAIPVPENGKVPEGCALRWSGQHVHVFARTPSGAPVDIARYVGIETNSVCPE